MSAKLSYSRDMQATGAVTTEKPWRANTELAAERPAADGL